MFFSKFYYAAYATSKFASIPLSHCVTLSPPPPFEADVINLWPLKIKKRKKDRIKKVTNSIYRSIFLIYVGRGHFVGTTSQERGVFCCGEGGCVRKVLQDVGNHPPCLRSDVYYCTEHLWCWTAGNKTTLLHAFNWLYTYWRVDFLPVVSGYSMKISGGGVGGSCDHGE